MIKTLCEHKQAVMAVSLSPNSLYAVSSSADKTMVSFQQLTRFQHNTTLPRTHRASALPLMQTHARPPFRSSGTCQKSTGRRKAQAPLPPLTRTAGHCSDPGLFPGVDKVAVLAGHHKSVNAAVYSPDGSFLVSGSADNSVKVWDISTLKETKTLNGHIDAVMAVSVHPDCATIASASQDRTVRIWTLPNGSITRILKGYTDAGPRSHVILRCPRCSGTDAACMVLPVSACTFASDGAFLLTGYGNRPRYAPTHSRRNARY